MLRSFHLSWKPTSQQSLFIAEQRIQCTNSRTDTMLTISAPWSSSVKILLVASPKALFSTLTSSLVWSACGVCLSCHSSAVVKTLLNSGWLSQRGQVQLCVYDPVDVRVKFYYECLCAWGAKRQPLPGCADETDCLVIHGWLQQWIVS